MTVYREQEQRRGRYICHLFRDCRVLSGKPYFVARVDGDDELITTCSGCMSGVSVPGHPNEREPIA